MVDEARGGSDDDSARETGVEEVLHGELAFEAAARGEGGEAAARQRENGVGDDLVLHVRSGRKVAEVEGGPIHPQEERADEREQI